MDREERQRILGELAKRSPEEEMAAQRIRAAGAGGGPKQRRARLWVFLAIAIPVVLVFIHLFVTPLVQPVGTDAARTEARRTEWQAGLDKRDRDECEGWTQRRADTAWTACGALAGNEGLRCLSDVQERSKRCGLSR